jgi:hypothetical protein
MNMPTDFGFRLQVIVTVLVAAAVLWVGVQTGDWTGLVLVVPLALLIPITAKLPSERPTRRRPGDPVKGDKDNGPRRY